MQQLEDYEAAVLQWPTAGRQILAQFDDDSMVVYQAFNENIASFAVEHQAFGGPHYDTERMTWIKPGFLWMMYRADWARKDANQARILRLTLSRAGFEELLRASWPSSWGEVAAGQYASRDAWKRAKPARDAPSAVLQWDPDHDPFGTKHRARKALQLGIRPGLLPVFRAALLAIEDVTPWVQQQRELLEGDGSAGACRLQVPVERVYPVGDGALAIRLGICDGAAESAEYASRDAWKHAKPKEKPTAGGTALQSPPPPLPPPGVPEHVPLVGGAAKVEAEAGAVAAAAAGGGAEARLMQSNKPHVAATAAAKTIVFIRHGESTAQCARRSERKTSAFRDAALTKRGEKQARSAGQLLAAHRLPSSGFDLVVVSQLTRALQTACGILGSLKPGPIPIVVRPELCEVGSIPENAPRPLQRVQRDACLVKHDCFRRFDFSALASKPAAEDGQSHAECFKAWLQDRSEDCILVVGHSMMLRALLHLDDHVQNCDPIFCKLDRGTLTVEQSS